MTTDKEGQFTWGKLGIFFLEKYSNKNREREFDVQLKNMINVLKQAEM